MKDILKHYSKYILLDTLVVATLFAGAHAILSLFHLKFIEWVYYAVIGIIIIGILLGIFQLLLKIRKNYVKYVAIYVETICLKHSPYIYILIFSLTNKKMKINKRNGLFGEWLSAWKNMYVFLENYVRVFGKTRPGKKTAK